jgi:hypothetical protein
MAYHEQMAGLIGGFGAGKTNIAAKWFVDRMQMYPKGTHAIANKDLPQYKRGTIRSLMDVLNDRQVPFSYNQSDGFLRLRKNGAKIEPLSAENYLGWRALEADTIWADEVSSWGPSSEIAFKEYLLPRSRLSPEGNRYRDRGIPIEAQLRFTTNPPTDTAHWLYDLLVRKNFCKYWHMSTYDNYLMKDQDKYIINIKRAFSEDMWPIILGGQWGNATLGAVYKGFNHKIHSVYEREVAIPSTLPPFRYDPNAPIEWALDFNVGYMCSVIFQFHMQKFQFVENDVPELFKPLARMERKRLLSTPGHQFRMMYVLDEIRLPDAGTPDVMVHFLRHWGERAKQHGVIIYGDASGGARSQTISAQSAARSNWAIILQTLRDYGIPYDFRVPRENPSVMDRINSTKLQFNSIDGVGMFIDTEKCPYLLQDYMAVKYKPGLNEIEKENPTLTHLSDALGYAIWIERQRHEGQQVVYRSERTI